MALRQSLAFIFLLTFNLFVSMTAKSIQIGDKLPHFILNNENREAVDISALTGKYLILYFYPKDETAGCTKQACSFRDAFQELIAADALVYGVSSDSPKSHQKFKEKYDLPFSLLSDTEGELRKLLGVPSDLFGFLPGRVTYVFNPEGRLIFIYKSQMSPETHVTEALKAIKGK